MRSLLIPLAAAVLTTGCFIMPFSGTCEEDTNCQPGLVCLQSVASKGGFDNECTMSEHKVCSRQCASDEDCADLEDGFCLETCTEGEGICTRRATSDLPLGGQCLDSSECAEGLTCIQGPEVTGQETCSELCSITCTDDADCTAIDPAAGCFMSCDGQTRVCTLAG